MGGRRMSSPEEQSTTGTPAFPDRGTELDRRVFRTSTEDASKLSLIQEHGKCLCAACAVRTFHRSPNIPPCTGSANVRCHSPL